MRAATIPCPRCGASTVQRNVRNGTATSLSRRRFCTRCPAVVTTVETIHGIDTRRTRVAVARRPIRDAEIRRTYERTLGPERLRHKRGERLIQLASGDAIFVCADCVRVRSSAEHGLALEVVPGRGRRQIHRCQGCSDRREAAA